MENMYSLECDLDMLAKEIFAYLKEKHPSTLFADKTCFVGGESCCRIDTYKIHSLEERGFITANVFFFRPDLTKDFISVKFSLFPPVWETSSKSRKLEKELEAIIVSHGGVQSGQQ